MGTQSNKFIHMKPVFLLLLLATSAFASLRFNIIAADEPVVDPPVEEEEEEIVKPDDAFDYALHVIEGIKAFLEAMKMEDENIDDLEQCFDLVPQVLPKLDDLITRIGDFKDVDLEGIWEMIQDAYGIANAIMTDIKPCMSSSDDLMRILHKILSIEFNDEFYSHLLTVVLTKAQPMINLIFEGIDDIKALDFVEFGHDFGDFLYELLYDVTEPKEALHQMRLRIMAEEETPQWMTIVLDVSDAIYGFFTGIELEDMHQSDINECIDLLPSVLPQFTSLIDELMELFDKGFTADGFMKILLNGFTVYTGISSDIKPCFKISDDIQRLYSLFGDLDFQEWLDTIAKDLWKQFAFLLNYIMDGIHDLGQDDYRSFGTEMGRLVYVLLFGVQEAKQKFLLV